MLLKASQVSPAIAVLPLLSVVDTDPVGSKTYGDPELDSKKIISDPDPASSRSEMNDKL
jgi:hypothetical protein